MQLKNLVANFLKLINLRKVTLPIERLKESGAFFRKKKESQGRRADILIFISFLLTINLKFIIVHVEIKIVNKEAATKRSTLLHAQRHACMVVHGRCTFEQSDVMLIRKGKRKEDN